MNAKENVLAVVVTYNRKKLLFECITSILAQSYPVYKLLIIDNASTDGTNLYLKSKGLLDKANVIYIRQESNTGGAGGFYFGLLKAREMRDIDCVWVMDDDTVPYSDSLMKLIEAKSKVEKPSFLASCVKGENGEPMNVPIVDKRGTENGYPYWYKKLDEGLVQVSSATFVSLLICEDAIKKCGLPCKDYFIWGDDSEYTRRLTTYYGKAYLVGESWVCHKRKNAKIVHIKYESDKIRIKNFYYHYRNRLINYYIYDGIIMYILNLLRFEGLAFRMLLQKKYGVTKFLTIQKAVFASTGSLKKFKRYIEEQLGHKMPINMH